MVVHDRIYRGILLLELNFNTLSVITIDNVDILQTHAMVSTLDATQSWHGTSIQCVQHMPESLQDVPTVIHNTIKHPQTFKFKPDWISRLQAASAKQVVLTTVVSAINDINNVDQHVNVAYKQQALLNNAPLASLEELESQELNTEVNTTLVEDSDDEDDEIEAVMDFVFDSDSDSEESDSL